MRNAFLLMLAAGAGISLFVWREGPSSEESLQRDQLGPDDAGLRVSISGARPKVKNDLAPVAKAHDGLKPLDLNGSARQEKAESTPDVDELVEFAALDGAPVYLGTEFAADGLDAYSASAPLSQDIGKYADPDDETFYLGGKEVGGYSAPIVNLGQPLEP